MTRLDRYAGAALAVLTALTLTACSPQEPPVPPLDPAAQLAARPTLDEAVAGYEQMRLHLQARLDAELGPFTWIQFYDGGWRGCSSEFPSELGGGEAPLALWGFEAAIPDTDWPRARQIITETIAGYGFAPGGLEIDQPGHHLLHAFDTTLGAHFTFSSQIHTSMRTTTGCHPSTQPR